MNPGDQIQGMRPRRGRGLHVLPDGGEAPPSLPHSLEAEECLLSCLLIDGGPALETALREHLKAGAFYSAVNRLIFEKICAIYAERRVVDSVVLAEELKVSDQLDQVGGYAYLAQISSRIPTTAQLHYFIDRLRELHLLRELIRAGEGLVEDCQGYQGGMDDLIGRFALKMQRWADAWSLSKRPSQRELALEAREMASAEAAGKVDRSRSVPLGGFPRTTEKFLSFEVREEDWFNILAGVPNGGKSTVLRQHAGYNLLAGKRMAVYLLETSAKRWLKALAGMFAGVNVRNLEEEAALHPERMKEFDAWQATITEWMEERLWIFDHIFHLEDIERSIRELNRMLRDRDLGAGVPEDKARGLDMVVGDHLHLLATRRDFRGNQREAQVSFIGRSLKMMHKSIDVPGFWAAQLNRKSREEQRRPRVSELRESGTLEQDADTVLLLHMPPDNKAGQKQDGNQRVAEVELIQGKRRNGPADIAVDLLFHKTLGRYEETDTGATVRPGMPKPADGYKRKGGAQ